MYCILQITTKTNTDEYIDKLITRLGRSKDIVDIYSKTSLASIEVSSPISDYIYANANHNINYLIAIEDEKTLRFFIERVKNMENLKLLVEQVQYLFNIIKSFLKQNNIENSAMSATIYSEGEEITTTKCLNCSNEQFVLASIQTCPKGISLHQK